MNTAGLWMLVALGALVIGTGLPVWALLIGVASTFAVLGLATGAADVGILSAMPQRLVGLLEHDLLQAMPLYVFIGVLLQRVAVADALFVTLARVATPLGRRTGAPEALATLGVGALLAPMNGSVASSSALLARLATSRARGAMGASATALVSVAATIGVVVPPSLVLILLGDAMLRAHTEASLLPGYAQAGQRIINTQDVLHAALLPALLVLLLWAAVAWRQHRRLAAEPLPPQRAAGTVSSLLAIAAILALLGGVFTGRLQAVEAAATGGCLLAAGVLLTRTLTLAAWRDVLADTLALSGALFALLVGATTFSLVFRLFGTDAWLSALLLTPGVPPLGAAALILLLVMLCAWVLDAFEMIFVIVPIIAPVLIARLGDAQQAAVLLLLVLQLSFLLPPLGYAVLMARAHAAKSGAPVSLRALLVALRPYLLVQLTVTALVFAMPRTVHWLDSPADAPTSAGGAAPADVPSADEVTRQLEEMAKPDAETKD